MSYTLLSVVHGYRTMPVAYRFIVLLFAHETHAPHIMKTTWATFSMLTRLIRATKLSSYQIASHYKPRANHKKKEEKKGTWTMIQGKMAY